MLYSFKDINGKHYPMPVKSEIAKAEKYCTEAGSAPGDRYE